MAKKHVVHQRQTYDSLPEAMFGAWCNEAIDLGILKRVCAQVPYDMTPKYTYIQMIQLKTKVKPVERTLLLPSTYTADFHIIAERPIHGLHEMMTGCKDIESLAESFTYVIDVKGRTKNTNTKGLFSLKQKMMMYANGVYVNKVLPVDFFNVNGWPSDLPEACYKKDGSGYYSWISKHIKGLQRSIKEAYNV